MQSLGRRPSREERMKYEIAAQIGLLPRVLEVGWAGLTPAESGRIGGLIARRLREERKQDVR
jgi:small acid-soluble spore protein F (minor alpha/beta-type SASP)